MQEVSLFIPEQKEAQLGDAGQGSLILLYFKEHLRAGAEI